MASFGKCIIKCTMISNNVGGNISSNLHIINMTCCCATFKSSILSVRAHISWKKLHKFAVVLLTSLGRNLHNLGVSKRCMITWQSWDFNSLIFSSSGFTFLPKLEANLSSKQTDFMYAPKLFLSYLFIVKCAWGFIQRYHLYKDEVLT